MLLPGSLVRMPLFVLLTLCVVLLAPVSASNSACSNYTDCASCNYHFPVRLLCDVDAGSATTECGWCGWNAELGMDTLVHPAPLIVKVNACPVAIAHRNL